MQINLIQKIAIFALPLLFAITVHEVAHGWVASKLGDKTAQILGRLTLNPLKHIDLFGTIIVPLTLLYLGGFMFGWAKPVPISQQNLDNRKRDLALIAIAGPISNLLMAIFWVLIMKLASLMLQHGWHLMLPVALMGEIGIIVNLALMTINLIPIPPLDGGRIVASILPDRIAYYYEQIEPYGFLIILVLIVTGILNFFVSNIILFLQHLIMML